MSSDPVVTITPDAGGPARDVPRNRRQEETFRKVLAAGVEVLQETSYADLTVRAVAARAKVAPATAYTYFSSKDHLLVDVLVGLVGHTTTTLSARPRRGRTPVDRTVATLRRARHLLGRRFLFRPATFLVAETRRPGQWLA